MHKKIQLFRRFSKFPYVFLHIKCSRKSTYQLLLHWTLHFAHIEFLIILIDSQNKTQFPISGLNKSEHHIPVVTKIL